MNSSNRGEINYAEKISNFHAMTENYDEELALRMLEKSNWDEALAVQEYFNSVGTRNSDNNTTRRNNNVLEEHDDRLGYFDESGVEHHGEFEHANTGSNTETNQQDEGGFIYKYIGAPIFWVVGGLFRFVYGFFGGSTMQVCTSLNRFNFIARTRNQLSSSLRNNKIGIAVFYENRNINYINDWAQSITTTDYIQDILRENFSIQLLNVEMPEANDYLNILNVSIRVPSMIFFRRGINKNNIIETIVGEIKFEAFRDILVKVLEMGEKSRSEAQMSNEEMILKQKEELKQLEIEEEKRRNKEREDEERKRKEEEEKAKQEKLKEELSKKKKKELSPEPDANDPNSTLIIFRYPDWSTRKERRYLRSDKIQSLYDFVDSLGTGIFQESDKYNLTQSMPRKVFENMEKTLEEEGLFPNAIVQINEI